jgi:alkylation response protein AidB-like acyl-CoA dehydrogenase
MYRAPVSEIAFTLKHVAGLGEALATGAFPGLTEDLVDAVLQEAGRFASERLAPLNRVGDQVGARLDDGVVTTAPGWREVFADWSAAGWGGVAAPESAGGQGLPMALSAAVGEMWNGACMSFSLCPLLCMGAIEAIERHGTDALRELYLPRIVSGEWTATMNLTEPQAGSDLGALTCRAERRADGTFRLFGQKIFITYGEHDLTQNIVHLVLARLPDAPPGSRGISLFLVPKVLPASDGKLGARNDVYCAGIEHKLGIHASPTCTMIYGDGRFGSEAGAVAWLVGEEHRGLACMFTMMNNARLMVGVQGVGQAELALQQATAFAVERRQGHAPGAGGNGMSLIAEHPDVRRMLMTMRALTEAARAICYACAVASDLGRAGTGDARERSQARAELLTPVAKAFSTDIANEVASLGVQIHGGMGFIEETGAAQTLRDARIGAIYEGTNGIQAIDLVARKLPLSDGQVVIEYINEISKLAESARGQNRPEFGRVGERLGSAIDDLKAATRHLQQLLAQGRTAEALAGAAPYLRLFGLAAGGAYLAKAALASVGDAAPRSAMRIATARFMAERLLPECAALRSAIVEGAEAVLAPPIPDLEAAS